MKKFSFNIRRSILDSLKRELIISEDYLKFQNKDTKENSFSTLNKEEIIAYRCGIRWISFRVTYGRDYQIYLKTVDKKVLKINFKSFFGKNRDLYQKKFKEIHDALWNCYFADIVENYLTQYKNGENFSIENVRFDTHGITILVAGILKSQDEHIKWEDVRTHDYITYFSIYSDKNPSDINRTYRYLEDWNTGILYSVLRTILHQKGIEEYN
ncbi:hypothetical protein M2T82_12890 [Elizabethkingia ursingii]|uniref:hypothetical protein n=1 Tax=Elizabethkingia ursingii TaxID=1756150 RepID=UPI002012B3BE|nr:hypothetical protein [Elizabethkingia ursingii]MCL1668958.1 hypothetical protein [Elizabethkingia ursingii]